MSDDHTCGCGHGPSDDTETTKDTEQGCCGGSCNCAEPAEFDHVSRVIKSVTNALHR